MNNDPRFPGHSSSRTFVFGACTGAKMQDIVDRDVSEDWNATDWDFEFLWE